VTFKGSIRENRAYIIIAIVVVIVIVLTVLFTTNNLFLSFIAKNNLGSWSEDIGERAYSSQLLGFEQWGGYTYRNNNDYYPAYVTVTSLKTLFMLNENDLFKKTVETISKEAINNKILIDLNTSITGIRTNNLGHKTKYIIYNGTDTNLEPFEQIKIIGESWNCAPSGSSIVCIGYAQITNSSIDPKEVNTIFWSKIISDPFGSINSIFIEENGLIFNVICH
jgi:hypothetical protein